jgi:hypothetical protein
MQLLQRTSSSRYQHLLAAVAMVHPSDAALGQRQIALITASICQSICAQDRARITTRKETKG